MNSKILSVVIIIFAIISTSFITLPSYATGNESGRLTIVADKNEIKKGEEVTFTIKASNIDGFNGIIMYNTIIEFDEKEFSFLEQDEIISAQGWSNFDRIENTVTFYRQDLLPNKDDQEIGKIRLRANNDITIGEKTITFSSNEFVVENTEKEEVSLNTDDIKINIKIVNENNNENNSENNDVENDVGNSEENQNTASIPGSNINYKGEEKSTIEKNLPKTGIMRYSGIVFIILLIIAIVAYIKYKKIG